MEGTYPFLSRLVIRRILALPCSTRNGRCRHVGRLERRIAMSLGCQLFYFRRRVSLRSGSPPENPPCPQISSREHVEVGGLCMISFSSGSSLTWWWNSRKVRTKAGGRVLASYIYQSVPTRMRVGAYGMNRAPILMSTSEEGPII
jgi:hypothetical protein